MKTVKGDLLKMGKNGDFEVIVHGCNCFHTMGAGIAAQIAKQFPNVYEADKQTEYGSKSKLGTYSMHTEDIDGHFLTVVNMYTQFSFGERRSVSYDAIADGFEALAEDLKQSHEEIRIGFPMIGAGLAGGDWDVIKVIIEKALDGLDHTLVVYDPNA